MPDWLSSTLTALPLFLAVIIGIGTPWTLVTLPRRDWRDRPMVACLSIAFGLALLSAWMFVLGTLGQNTDPDAGQTLNPMQTTLSTHSGGTDLLRPDLIAAGLVVLALVGLAAAAIKARRTAAPVTVAAQLLAPDEKVLIGFIVVALLARWLITGWLPFGSWDPLWVYGYQARIYTLVGYIPADIGYYPQFMQLQYAFGQIMTGDVIDDHAARAVLPLVQVGSILMTYILGARLFNRRVGIIAAALWALYPHMAYWSRVGDLEIPVTFGFTGAAAFFLMAWGQADQFYRRRYALVAGLFFGVAMWTKPTAGAFVYGVVLLVVVEFVRVRGDWRAWLPRFEVAFITGLACIPLGAVWYLRNVLLGHDAIVFPPSFWLTQAMRSGAEFGWPLLALGLLVAYAYFGPDPRKPNVPGGVIGVGLVALGVAPTIIDPARMGPLEWLALVAGVMVLLVTLGRFARAELTERGRRTLVMVGWVLLLVAPYFVTWFYSYSYHYRLSFPIVPLMIVPSAVILALWFSPARMAAWRFPRRLAYAALVVALCLPGAATAVYDEGLGWDWLWTIPPEDDYSKAGLLGVVATIEDYIAAHDDPPHVLAPGLQTLPFFFPTQDIRIVRTPREIDQTDGFTHFINSRNALLEYSADGEVAPYQNQWLASLPRENVTTRVAKFDDPSFFYDVYELQTEARFTSPAVQHPVDVTFGDFAQLVGYNLSGDAFGEGVVIDLVWESLAPAPADYTLYVHLVRGDDVDTLYDGWDGPVRYWDLNYYSTLFWEPGEYIIDRRTLFLHDPATTPAGDDYRIRIGFYDPTTDQRVPVGDGDGYLLETTFTVP